MIGEDFGNTRINIWVQIHRLPFELRNQMFAKGLAAIAGTVKDSDQICKNSENLFAGEFLKYRVELDTNKPIVPGFFLQRQDKKPVWIHLKYVKLPAVCFKYGKLNHDPKFYIDQNVKGVQLFKRWLRADDKSWNIPVWQEESIGNSEFKTISMKEVVTQSKIRRNQEQSLATETVLNCH